MLLKEEINKYLNYCKFQKELDDKTIKAYKADLEQFITVIGENNPDKETLNSYLLYLHRMYKQKTVKRKIASVKALFHYLEEEELIEINPFHKVKTKFREEVILPKIIPRVLAGLWHRAHPLCPHCAGAECPHRPAGHPAGCGLRCRFPPVLLHPPLHGAHRAKASPKPVGAGLCGRRAGHRLFLSLRRGAL